MLRRMSTPSPPPTSNPRTPALVALALAAAGIVISFVLLREHLTVFEGDTSGGLFCGGAGKFDCNTVAAHASSWFLRLPLSLWGVGFYVVIGVLSACALWLPIGEAAAAAGLGSVLTLAAVLIDGWLGWIMVTQIGAICLNCVSTYVINLILAVAFWRLDRRLGAPREWRALLGRWRTPRPGRVIKLASVVVAVAGIATAYVVTARALDDMIEDSKQEAADFLRRAATEKPVDMTQFEGLPAEGPARAPITIVVAGDLECSFCRALAARMDEVRAEHPNDLRILFLNAPISMRCNPYMKFDTHTHACWLARAGVCAARQGKFWRFHDLVYRDIPPARVDSIGVTEALPRAGIDATALAQCMTSPEADSVVARDVRLWHTLKMESVPSLIINGHVKTGGIYPTTLRAVIHALLARPS